MMVMMVTVMMAVRNRPFINDPRLKRNARRVVVLFLLLHHINDYEHENRAKREG